jgi:hypothetical protein
MSTCRTRGGAATGLIRLLALCRSFCTNAAPRRYRLAGCDFCRVRAGHARKRVCSHDECRCRLAVFSSLGGQHATRILGPQPLQSSRVCTPEQPRATLHNRVPSVDFVTDDPSLRDYHASNTPNSGFCGLLVAVLRFVPRHSSRSIRRWITAFQAISWPYMPIMIFCAVTVLWSVVRSGRLQTRR